IHIKFITPFKHLKRLVVYQCLSNNPNMPMAGTNFSDFSLFYNYDAPRYLIYSQLIKEEDHPEKFLLYISYDVKITVESPHPIKCQSGSHSLNFQSNICIYTERAQYQNSIYTQFMKFIKFSSSGSVIDVGNLNVTDKLDFHTSKIYSTIPLPYGGVILFDVGVHPLNNTFNVQTFDLDTMVNGDILYTNTSTAWLFGLRDYGVFSNNTICNYFIIANDDFVRTSIYHDPVLGIKKGIWIVTTPQQANYSKISESTEALLRLNHDGASYFSSYNQSQLLDDLLQQIKYSIPFMDDRLKITHNVQSDPSDPSKLLIEFSIDKATDPLNDPSVNDIINDLNIIIKSKYISSLSDKTFMTFIDELYGFQVK
ncbi:13058_t:CDS:2, partial [Racocetra persica]